MSGRAEYVHNLRLPGMLYGKICRSTVAHGRIRRIDVSAAQAVPGVHRIVTAQDIRAIIPEPYYGPAFHDQPILALDKVRYAGEPVAVGAVVIGDVPSWRVDHMPYGGVKESGLGREGVRYAIQEMTEPRLLTIQTE